MKVLVLNPVTNITKNVIRDVMYGCWCKGKRIGGATVPPYTLLVLTSFLRKNGHSADFLDAQAEQIPLANVAALITNYDLLIISTSTMSFSEDADYILALKRANSRLKTVMFGSHPTFMPTYCLAHNGPDFIVRHEPENIILNLADTLDQHGDISTIKGIGYRDANGNVTLNEQEPLIEDLDILPFPDVDLLPKGIDYFNPIVRRTPYITTSTSRGCPGKCTFCTAPAFDGNRLRFNSADYVIRQIEYFLEKGFNEIYFRDDTFFVNRQRDHRIFQHIVDNKLDIGWIANARVSLLKEDTIALAREAGCHTIKFGIESGVQSILDGMNKGYKIEQAYQVLTWVKKAGIRSHAHVMLGNPGDTIDTIKETVSFVKRLDPTTATFGICTPYPGTPLFEEVRRVHPEIGDGSSSDLSKLHVQGLFNEHYTSLNREEINAMPRYAYRKFYLRPSYLLLSLFRQIRSFHDIKRLSIAATNVLDFTLRGE
jgi:radical SAM superfamily enzyme YgiQ (UPF0313 family)